MKRKFELWAVAAVISVATLLIFHFPFFRYITENVEKDFSGCCIVLSLVVIMLAANFLASYLVLWLGRLGGKILCALAFICNAATLYFINTYDVIVDDSMMGNVFNTNWTEATSYWSPAALLYLLLAGVLPAAVIIAVNIDYGSLKRFIANIGASIAVLAAVILANMPNLMWVDKNSTVMGSLLMPWSYVVNAVRYHSAVRENRREEIPLPDAEIADSSRAMVILVIGESARRDHFSLYGYERQTNPRLAAVPGLKVYKANSSATCTTDGVKAILDHKPTDKLYEILPNYLYRAGVDVMWRTSNWGQPPLHIGKYLDSGTIASRHENLNSEHDGILLEDLRDSIMASTAGKLLVILHTSTSHGPSYSRRYPGEFGKWSPVPQTVEMSKCPVEHLINAYDNSILYTDWLLERTISIASSVPDRRSAVIYVSDHGESLGENGLYMHGVPVSIAPAGQIEIPFLAWSSDPRQVYKDYGTTGQHHVFHSVLHFLGISSPVYDESMNIFE